MPIVSKQAPHGRKPGVTHGHATHPVASGSSHNAGTTNHHVGDPAPSCFGGDDLEGSRQRCVPVARRWRNRGQGQRASFVSDPFDEPRSASSSPKRSVCDTFEGASTHNDGSPVGGGGSRGSGGGTGSGTQKSLSTHSGSGTGSGSDEVHSGSGGGRRGASGSDNGSGHSSGYAGDRESIPRAAVKAQAASKSTSDANLVRQARRSLAQLQSTCAESLQAMQGVHGLQVFNNPMYLDASALATLPSPLPPPGLSAPSLMDVQHFEQRRMNFMQDLSQFAVLAQEAQTLIQMLEYLECQPVTSNARVEKPVAVDPR